MNRLLVFSIIVFLVFLLGLAEINRKDKNYSGLIYPNVIINNIDFGGKNPAVVEDYFKNKNSSLKKINIQVIYQSIPIATFSGDMLNIGYDATGAASRAMLIGRMGKNISSLYQRMASLLNWQKFYLNIGVNYDLGKIRDFAENMQEQYGKPARNALFQFENGKVISFRQEEKGLEVETDKFIKNFNDSTGTLDKNIQDISIDLPFKIIEPEITLAKANDFGIEGLIAEGKSDFTHSIPGRIHNIILAASKFNGVLIPQGQTFSFNNTIGDISSFTGYQPAYIIKGGKTVLGDGGGVCQVSTTLFRAALNAGLPIVERTAHAYRVGYYENDSKPGFDATVFAPSPDLKIKNDTAASILIETSVDQDNNLLFFKFYGKKDNRKIEISPVRVYDVVPPLPDLHQDDPTLKKGVVKQVDFPAWGSKAVFSYKVTRDGQTTFEKQFFSNYQPWQAVYLVGTAD